MPSLIFAASQAAMMVMASVRRVLILKTTQTPLRNIVAVSPNTLNFCFYDFMGMFAREKERKRWKDKPYCFVLRILRISVDDIRTNFFAVV